MSQPSGRPADEVERMIHTHGNMLYRTCLVLLKNPADAEDAVQETALRYMEKAPAFRSGGHERAWLLRVAGNLCRDMLRRRQRHCHVDISGLFLCAPEAESSGILEALMSIPEQFRIVMVLHYVEGYTAAEIAPIIRKTPSAVKMRLQKGRKLLEDAYGKEDMS